MNFQIVKSSIRLYADDWLLTNKNKRPWNSTRSRKPRCMQHSENSKPIIGLPKKHICGITCKNVRKQPIFRWYNNLEPLYGYQYPQTWPNPTRCIIGNYKWMLNNIELQDLDYKHKSKTLHFCTKWLRDCFPISIQRTT